MGRVGRMGPDGQLKHMGRMGRLTTVRGGIRADQHEHSMSRYHTTEVRSPIQSELLQIAVDIEHGQHNDQTGKRDQGIGHYHPGHREPLCTRCLDLQSQSLSSINPSDMTPDSDQSAECR